jgi:hypothetical protein
MRPEPTGFNTCLRASSGTRKRFGPVCRQAGQRGGGKKNWLFIGHPEAGWRSAVIYSVIASCQRRGIDPWEYVRDVLNRLPGMKQSELPSLLPRSWKPSDKRPN